MELFMLVEVNYFCIKNGEAGCRLYWEGSQKMPAVQLCLQIHLGDVLLAEVKSLTRNVLMIHQYK